MADDLEALPELDPGVESLLRAYRAETARSPAQVDAALEQVSLQLGPGAAGATGLSATAKFAIASVAMGVVGVVGLAMSRPEPAADRPPAVAQHDPPADRPSAHVDTDSPIDDAMRSDSPAPRDASSADASPAAPVEAAPPSNAAHDERPITRPRTKSARQTGDGAAAQSPDQDAPTDTLAEELALLQRARTALRDGIPARAIELVVEHRRRYPSSTVAEERDATSIAALCASDRPDEARDEATAFAARHPHSTRDLLAACDG